ncbi:MAG: hypothetical protein M3527_02610, partial [Actinomycetota bacterium]|nr:hypothetical protein [Actinomycetota bacterium]
LLPFGDAGTDSLGAGGVAVGDGNAAAVSDGVGCIVCHSSAEPPAERAGNGAQEGVNPLVANSEASMGGFSTVYGPLFSDPNPLPVRVHGIETNTDGSDYWLDDLETSQLCGACHNVKLDIDAEGEGDGTIGVDGAEEMGIVEILDAIEDGDDLDGDDDFQLDENELDDNRVQVDDDDDGEPDDVAVQDGGDNDDDGVVDEPVLDNDGDGDADGGDGRIDDLVLQTTYDEWQDYVAFFDEPGGFTDRYDESGAEFPNELSRPLGCNGCHMPLAEDPTRAVVDYAPGLLSAPERFTREHSFVGVDYDLDPELYRKSGLSNEEIARVVAERDALIQSAATLEVVNGDVIDTGIGDGLVVDVVVRNNLLAHSFPTGFAFARQFWIEVSAETSDGETVCLIDPFVDGDPFLDEVEAVGAAPCASGVEGVSSDEVDDPIQGDAELRQCDTRAFSDLVATLEDGVFSTAFGAFAFPNLDIDFPGDPDDGDSDRGAFAPDECDPWLANFQKILTDGDPDLNGVRFEVPYQPLLPNAVQNRGRLVNGQIMAELQPVRLKDTDGDFEVDDPAESVVVPYVFDVTGIDPADVVVTARLRFRHLPPYFVRDLEARQQELGDDVPEGARIDADELLSHMVVGEIVTATSGDGEQLECEGPQNGADSILECISDADVAAVLQGLDIGGGSVGGGGEDRTPVGLGGGQQAAVLPSRSRLALGIR